jgi:hypothetical protein
MGDDTAVVVKGGSVNMRTKKREGIIFHIKMLTTFCCVNSKIDKPFWTFKKS